MPEQLPGAARVLGGHHVALAQHAQRAQRDVLQVANRRGHEVKRAGGKRRQCGIHAGNKTENPAEIKSIRREMKTKPWPPKTRQPSLREK